jgi:hypothetical protein
MQQRGDLGLLFILAVVKRGDLHQQPLFILLRHGIPPVFCLYFYAS